jgi:hypothetical protein
MLVLHREYVQDWWPIAGRKPVSTGSDDCARRAHPGATELQCPASICTGNLGIDFYSRNDRVLLAPNSPKPAHVGQAACSPDGRRSATFYYLTQPYGVLVDPETVPHLNSTHWMTSATWSSLCC